MKIVINNCFGGFSVSEDFLDYYKIPYKKLAYGGTDMSYSISRTDKRLIEYIEKFGGRKASGRSANLIIVEIPNGELYQIDYYDGMESIRLAKDEEWLVAKDDD